MLIWPKTLETREAPIFKAAGPEGTLAQFLQDFGKELVEKYNPRAIVVFSAHWEAPRNQILGKSLLFLCHARSF
jgi:aromatic ring-opening dioxygenase catalytic subunit (LigB family)